MAAVVIAPTVPPLPPSPVRLRVPSHRGAGAAVVPRPSLPCAARSTVYRRRRASCARRVVRRAPASGWWSRGPVAGVVVAGPARRRPGAPGLPPAPVPPRVRRRRRRRACPMCTWSSPATRCGPSPERVDPDGDRGRWSTLAEQAGGAALRPGQRLPLDRIR